MDQLMDQLTDQGVALCYYLVALCYYLVAL
jgi:hypothetical protein